jgi:hypothetical protein
MSTRHLQALLVYPLGADREGLQLDEGPQDDHYRGEHECCTDCRRLMTAMICLPSPPYCWVVWGCCSHRGEASRASLGDEASSGGSTPRHAAATAAAAADGYPSLGRKAKIPSSSTAVLGPRDALELLPRSSYADGGALPEQSSSTSAASTAAGAGAGADRNLTGTSTTSNKAGSTGRRSERPNGSEAAGSVASRSHASLAGVSAQPTARALGDVVFGRQSMAVKVSEEATKKVRRQQRRLGRIGLCCLCMGACQQQHACRTRNGCKKGSSAWRLHIRLLCTDRWEAAASTKHRVWTSCIKSSCSHALIGP